MRIQLWDEYVKYRMHDAETIACVGLLYLPVAYLGPLHQTHVLLALLKVGHFRGMSSPVDPLINYGITPSCESHPGYVRAATQLRVTLGDIGGLEGAIKIIEDQAETLHTDCL